MKKSRGLVLIFAKACIHELGVEFPEDGFSAEATIVLQLFICEIL